MGNHPDLHVLTHSFPTRRSSDLVRDSFFWDTGVGGAGLVIRGDGDGFTLACGLGDVVARIVAALVQTDETEPGELVEHLAGASAVTHSQGDLGVGDRKSTRLNSSP